MTRRNHTTTPAGESTATILSRDEAMAIAQKVLDFADPSADTIVNVQLSNAQNSRFSRNEITTQLDASLGQVTVTSMMNGKTANGVTQRFDVEGRTCAVLLEPVQGEGGVNVPDEGYLQKVQDFCKEKNILFMLDEVQTGMGRLGTVFGYQRFEGVEPDVMTLGKALGSGAPLGAFACKEFCSVLEPGDHGSTFGGNALTTAAGGAGAKALLDEDGPGRAMRNGEYLTGKLNALREDHEVITEVRGMGMLIGVEMKEELSAAIVADCAENGLLLNAVRPNMLRFMPPLNASTGEIDEAIAILDSALAKSTGRG